MKTIYPYDPDANLASNRVTDDVDVNVYPNAFKVVVPESAPFYRFDLEIRDEADRLLVEGLDYYLGYYSKDVSEGTGKPVYGGIMLFDVDIAKVKLRSVGGTHMVPMSEVGRFLTDPELQDPRNTDWSELQRYPTIVEPVDKPDSIEEALENDVVVKALDGVRANILEKIGDLDVKYTGLIQALEDVAIKIHDHQLYLHHENPHQHNYTRADLNVLGVDETAIDAVKAYGLTLQEVVDEMVTFGINQERIDNLLNDDLSQIVKGAFNVTPSNDLILQHESGNAKITLDGVEFRMETTAGEVVYEADAESVEAGIGLEIGAGYNVLLVPSNGATQGGHPSFNGKVIITTANILDFLHKPASAQANVHSVSTATLELAGRGVVSSPFKANAVPPIADVNTTGLWRITDSLLITGDGYGISQWALNQIRNSLNDYVDKTFSVNGEVFGDDETIVLTKAHIGLSNAQDTSPEDKPITTALTNATAGKALDGHSHVKADLKNVPVATNSAEGIGMLHDIIDDTANKFATPRTGMELEGLIDDVENDVAGRVKAGSASATFYGGADYLPVPALGNYAGYADTRNSLHTAALFEKNRLVCLRNGGDGIPDTEAAYYWYADKSDVGLSDIVRTSLAYHPAFLDKKYPGFRVRYVMHSCPEAILVNCKNFETGASKVCLVLTLGTMDMSKHTIGCEVSQGQYDGPYGRDEYSWAFSYAWDRLTVDGPRVYTVRSILNNTEHYCHIGYLNIADIADADTLQFNPMTLSGTDHNGDAHPPRTVFELLKVGVYRNTDPANGSVSFSSDDNYWAGSRNTSHGPCRNFIAHADGNKMRVRTESSVYLSNSYTSHWGGVWHTSYTIDLLTGTVTADHNNFPLEIAREGVLYPNGSLRMAGMPGFAANNVGHSCYGQPGFSAFVTHSNIQRAPHLYVEKLADDYDHLEQLKYNKFNEGRTNIASLAVTGVHGSGVTGNYRGALFLEGEDYLITYLNNGKSYLCKYAPDSTYGYDGWEGYGPTNDREVYNTSEYVALSKIPRICKGDVVYLNGAQHTGKGQSVPYLYDSVLKTADKTKQTAVTDVLWEEVLAYIAEQIKDTESPIDDPRKIAQYLTLTFYDFGGHNVVDVNYQSLFARQDDKSGPKKKRWISYTSTFTAIDVAGVMTVTGIDTANMTRVYSETSSGSWRSLSSQTTSGQCSLIETNDGLMLSVMNLCRYGTVGGSGQTNHYYRVKDNVVTWQSRPSANTSYGEVFMAYLKEHKQVMMGGFKGNSEFLGGTVYSVEDIATGLGQSVIHGSKTAEGWLIYFTQTVQFYAEEATHTLPASEFDLSKLYPGTQQDRTFYIHADVTDGTPKYTIDEAIKPDTPTRLWVGRATTNKERIIDLDVKRARRLGSIAPLLQHAQSKYAHRYDVADSLVASEYSLLENKGMVHDFDVVSFKDVFDSWYRFSHNHIGKYPASAAELLQWRYLEDTDTIENLTNSGTFIGFISDKMAGDYVFNTVVSSNNNDDDGIFIVLAAFKQGDIDSKEHTLSLQMNTGGFGTATPYVCIQKNQAQPSVERIFTLDPNSDGSNTGRGWSPADGYETFHVYAKREKNRLLVYVARKLLPKQTGIAYEKIVGDYVDSVRGLQIADFEAEGYLVADLDLADVAPEFARATRFGYGSLSQPVSRFWNIERPLSNLDSFYSSEQMVLESMAKADGMYKKVYGETLRSSVGTKLDPSNHAYLGWPKATRYTFQGNSSGIYVKPPGSTMVAPTEDYKGGGDHYFYLRKDLVFTSTTLNVTGVADDRLELYVDGVAKGTAAGSTQASKDFPVVVGDRSIALAIWNGPAGSQCCGAFVIKDAAATIDVSDESWYCDASLGGADDLKVAKVSYVIPEDVTDIFNVYPKVSTTGISPNEAFPPVYVPQSDGAIEVSRFVDVTHGDVAWEISMIKKKI